MEDGVSSMDGRKRCATGIGRRDIQDIKMGKETKGRKMGETHVSSQNSRYAKNVDNRKNLDGAFSAFYIAQVALDIFSHKILKSF